MHCSLHRRARALGFPLNSSDPDADLANPSCLPHANPHKEAIANENYLLSMMNYVLSMMVKKNQRRRKMASGMELRCRFPASSEESTTPFPSLRLCLLSLASCIVSLSLSLSRLQQSAGLDRRSLDRAALVAELLVSSGMHSSIFDSSSSFIASSEA
eukprot:3206083-Rhodomonas_salina.2